MSRDKDTFIFCEPLGRNINSEWFLHHGQALLTLGCRSEDTDTREFDLRMILDSVKDLRFVGEIQGSRGQGG